MSVKFGEMKGNIDDEIVENIPINTEKRKPRVKSYFRSVKKAVTREMKYAIGGENCQHVDNQEKMSGDNEKSRENVLPVKFMSPKDVYGSNMWSKRNTLDAEKSNCCKVMPQEGKKLKRNAKMELRRLFGSNRDTMIAPLVTNELSTFQGNNVSGKGSSDTERVSNMKKLKKLGRLSKKELKYMYGSSNDSKVTPL